MVEAKDGSTFEPIHQPYSVGTPVRDREIFFGRQDDFRFVRQRLLAEREGIVLSLVGPRRSGKTSIMVQIQNGELGEEFLPFFIDMQQMAGVIGDREFFARLATLLLESLDDERLVAGFYRFEEGNPILTFDGLLADIQKAYPDRRLLFLVDEAEILEAKVNTNEFSTDVLTYMSSILENRQVSFCLTGSLGMIVVEGEHWRRLTAKGDYLEISYLSRDDTYRLIQEPVAGEVTYADGVAERIYQLTAGWPFYVQLTCFYLVVHLNQMQRNLATNEDIDAVVRAIVNNPPPQLVYQWEELEANAKIVLALVGEQSQEAQQVVDTSAIQRSIKDNKYPLDLKEEGIKVVLEGLYADKHLERSEEGAYYFRVDLFRQWVRRHRSVWRLVGQNKTPQRSRLWWGVAPVALVLVAWLVWIGQDQQVAAPSMSTSLPTVGEVWVEAEPADVRVFVDAVLHPNRTPTLVRELSPGSHTIRIEHDDYHSQERHIQVRAGVSETLPLFRLQRLNGVLSVEVSPTGARVQIEGEVDTSGMAPLRDLVLPTGVYDVSVTKHGYVTQTRRVDIRADEQTALSLKLPARVGGVRLASTPPGARVFIDGRVLKGQTPLYLENVAVGQHEFRFEMADRQIIKKSASISLGHTAVIEAQLDLLPATVMLKTQPAGVEVRVDGADSLWGLTPVAISFAPGEHRIDLTHDGYDAQILEQAWDPGQADEPPLIVLERQYGLARFVRPFSGDLYVDGQLKKKGVLGNIRFAVGRYVFRIDDKEQTVHIFKDSTIVVRFE